MIWINVVILIVVPLGTYFSENSNKNTIGFIQQMRLKMSSAKRRPFCRGLDVLRPPCVKTSWTLTQIKKYYYRYPVWSLMIRTSENKLKNVYYWIDLISSGYLTSIYLCGFFVNTRMLCIKMLCIQPHFRATFWMRCIWDRPCNTFECFEFYLGRSQW